MLQISEDDDPLDSDRAVLEAVGHDELDPLDRVVVDGSEAVPALLGAGLLLALPVVPLPQGNLVVVGKLTAIAVRTCDHVLLSLLDDRNVNPMFTWRRDS